jgi:site-specific DNA-methyltransferase (adenine-specific)
MNNYNPDVLSCLANLSNDEVFTPPHLVNEMLDLLPKNLWSNSDAKFLDPVCKSGVFLREIAKRLMGGLEKKIPDKQKRINHIFSKQLYGIALTELTSLLSRRSVYCSKIANGKYSVCDDFGDKQGNIRYNRIQHTWKDGKCVYCGVNQLVYEREDDLETYAYNFIHIDIDRHSRAGGNHFDNKLKEILNMKFDVIIGNPPYQLSDKSGGQGSGATAIYHKFVEQAMKLQPKYITMIVKSDWTSDSTKGDGIRYFRKKMVDDNKISVIHQFPNSKDCFPQNEIDGGVSYFLWDRSSNKKDIDFYLHINKDIFHTKRPLADNGDINLNYREIDFQIKQKVASMTKKFMSSLVSTRKPYGFDVLTDEELNEQCGEIKCYSYMGIGYISRKKITKNEHTIDKP